MKVIDRTRSAHTDRAAADGGNMQGAYGWWGTAGLGVALGGLHFAASGQPIVREAAWSLLVAGACAAIFIGIRHHRPRRRQPWVVLGIGFALLTVGNLLRFPAWAGPAALGVVSDLLELVAFPLLGLAALGMVRRQTPQGDREGALDGALVMVALLTVLSGTVFSPETLEVTSVLGNVLLVVAPVILAFVSAMAARLLFVGTRAVSTYLLVGATASAFIGHVLRTFAQSAGTYGRGEWMDVFIAGAYLSVGLAALHPSMVRLTLPMPPAEGRLSLSRLTILGVCLLVPPGTILLTGAATIPVLASVVVAALVLWRLWRLVLEREAVRDDMRHQAIHDALTGLPNRTEVLNRLERALERADADSVCAVLFIDLDGFKRVNDDFSHRIGDATLIAVVRRLQEICRGEDLLGRLSGDEFVLVCEGLEERAVLTLAERVVAAFTLPFVLPEATVSLGASVGVALHVGPGGDPDQLLSEADAAMYQSKEEGGQDVNVFGAALGERLLRRRRLELDLVQALADDQLHLVYQPMFALHPVDGEGSVVGAEALLRWDHPELGPIEPAEVVPIADASGMIIQVGEWVFRQAAAQLARWRDDNDLPAGFQMFVNVSPRQLLDGALPVRLRRLAGELGIEPGSLVLEVTETAVLDDTGRALHTLRDLSAAGFAVALDDFGTGFSSLTHLKRLPLDLIKIDATFVEDLPSSPDDQAIISAILGIARQLGLRVVGEGIEEPRQRQLLTELGCDYGQGHLLGSPVPADEVRLPSCTPRAARA